MNVRTAFNLRAASVDEAMEGGGFWHSCSGCYEAEGGPEPGSYSSVLKCYIGGGCGECGGIGAIWEPEISEADLVVMEGLLGDRVAEDVPGFDLKELLGNLGARAGLSFGMLQRACAARNIEWHGDEQPDLLFRAVEMGGEAGEALNIVKKLVREGMGSPGSLATVDDLAEELADVVICVVNLAAAEGIHLAAAVARKFNATSDKLGLQTKLRAAGIGGAA